MLQAGELPFLRQFDVLESIRKSKDVSVRQICIDTQSDALPPVRLQKNALNSISLACKGYINYLYYIVFPFSPSLLRGLPIS